MPILVRVRFLAAVMLVGSATACTTPRTARPLPSTGLVADSGASITDLGDGVYAIVRKEPLGLLNESNSLVIVGDKEVVMVDAQSSTGRTLETLRLVRHVTRKPITAVINTHWHDDHVFGNTVYRDSFPGVAFIAHETAIEDLPAKGLEFRRGSVRSAKGTAGYLRGLATRGQSFLGGAAAADEARSHALSASIISDWADGDSTSAQVLPTRTVSDRLTLRQGRRVIEIIHPGRGHTRGDLIVHLPREGIVATGDLLMWPVQFIGSTSYPADYSATLERIRGLRARTVVPGHGPVQTAAALEAHVSNIAALTRLIASRAVEAVAKNDSLPSLRATLDLAPFEQRMAGDNGLRKGLFQYYVRGSAVARAYELAKADTEGAGAPAPGEAVIRDIHAANHRVWYRTMTFIQRTILPGRPDQTWYESVMMPGMLRIDIAPVDSQNTILYRRDSVYRYRRGQLVVQRPDVHSLALLIADVNVLPPDSSIRKLRGLGFDLARVHHRDWNGRTVVVVGATQGDSVSPQFWIDRERRYLVRLIERDADARTDWHVGGHSQHAGVWIESDLSFYRNGALVQREVYSDVRLNVPLEPAVFEPSAWKKPSWIQ